jgi:NAD(P)-dependent dehydrogenase (short-subunit alcohol dehydrogenase family)
MPLANRIALVTGAAKGIGKAITVALIKTGARPVLLDIDTPGLIETVNDLEKSTGVVCPSFTADVGSREAVEQVVRKIETSVGPIDILVNNAGIWRWTPLLDMDEATWDNIFSVNVKGVLFCTQAVGRWMVVRRRGKIVNIASMAGFGGGLQWGAYCASKAAVISLTQTTAIELRPFNVQVNAVCPGATDTGLADYIERMMPGTRFERHRPEDVAARVIDLVDPFEQDRSGEIIKMK